jgi:hypothetical protein
LVYIVIHQFVYALVRWAQEKSVRDDDTDEIITRGEVCEFICAVTVCGSSAQPLLIGAKEIYNDIREAFL